MIGKLIRLERIFDRNTGKTVIVPMDHGVTVGPIPGLQDVVETVARVVNGGANAVLMHKGIVRAGHRSSGRDVGLIVHLSASTSLSPDPDQKRRVCTVEEAIRLGADGVSMHINLGAETEPAMLEDLGEVAEICDHWDMPLIAMMYTRGARIDNEFDVTFVKHAARVGAELGADVVKVPYTGSVESFREVVDGCHVPVVIAGGPKLDTERDIFEMVAGALEAGARGISIGRNAFQHRDPERMLGALCRIVHEDASVEEAERFMRGEP